MEIENFIKNDVVRLIASKTESKNHDFKEKCYWNSEDQDTRFKIVKDILAMANTQDGGKIIIGVEDNSFNLIGMSKDDFESFDQTKVNQLLENYSDPKSYVQVYKFHDIDGKRIVMVDIPEFKEMPIICAKDADSSKDGGKKILRKGAIYLRTESAESKEIDSSEDMREFLMRAIRRKSDDLLRNIEILLSGKSFGSNVESSSVFNEQILDAEKYFNDKFPGMFANNLYWEMISFPLNPNTINKLDFPEQKILLEESQVNIRSWNFPYIPVRSNSDEQFSNFNFGVQSYSDDGEFKEIYRFYQNGLFVLKVFPVEGKDVKTEENRRKINFFSVIWSLMEFFIFLSRFYRNCKSDDRISIEIKLNNCKDVQLISFYPRRIINPNLFYNENIIIAFQNCLNYLDVRLNHMKLAADAIKRVFNLFSWNSISIEEIFQLQDELINKRLS
jgi:hypothetical protein